MASKPALPLLGGRGRDLERGSPVKAALYEDGYDAKEALIGPKPPSPALLKPRLGYEGGNPNKWKSPTAASILTAVGVAVVLSGSTLLRDRSFREDVG